MPLSSKISAPLSFVVIVSALAVTSVFFSTTRCYSQQLSGDTLESLLNDAVQAFSSGDYAASAGLFVRIEEEFGNEPVFQEGGFLRRILPLKGYAELRSGVPGEAAETFERYMARFDSDQRPNAFVLYNLALAQRENARPDEALRHLQSYRELYPHNREAALAALQQAEILFELEREDDALSLLHDFSESDAPSSIREQARLLAARRAMENGLNDLARVLLLENDWDVESVREVAVLSFAAMELGDRLMDDENYPDAIRSYRLALPRRQLISLQRDRLESLSRYAPGASTGNPAEAVTRGGRADFHRNLFRRSQRQLLSLEESPDYTPSLTLRRGHAFLMAGRHREAWLIFESLALDERLDASLREDAHYRWVLAANGLEVWEEALTIARNFTVRYENSTLAPNAFYLIAQAHSEQRRYPEAIEVLSDLIDRFPEHPLRRRWLFTRGFSFALLERFEEARTDFMKVRDAFPEARLTANAELWHALTWFFERNYSTALEEFDRLAESYAEHRLTGEILYRRAATLYAMGDLDSALVAATDFTNEYPGHQRHSEALVLAGDILMGRGELNDAVSAFREVPPEAGSMFLYAVFQIGKVYRALQEHEAMTAHFRGFLERDDIPQNARISEALYWIGWAYTRMDRPEAAFPLFLETLELYGNDRDAREIGSILTALEELHRRIRQNDGTTNFAGAGRLLLAAGDFNHWLEAERDAALRNDRITWYARVSLELSERLRFDGRRHRADEILLEISNHATPEDLDAACLGLAGHFLREHRLAAGETFLLRLLEDFPNAPEAAYANYGLARIAYENREYDDALLSLRRFHRHAPGHRLAVDASLLEATVFEKKGDLAAAREAYESVLRQRAARGRPHAIALRGLAGIHRNLGEPEKAIAYYQRIYTLYLAYRDLVAEAYYESGLLFEEIGDIRAAYETFREMTNVDELSDFEVYEHALGHRERLRDELSDDPAAPENDEQPL